MRDPHGARLPAAIGHGTDAWKEVSLVVEVAEVAAAVS